MTLKLTTNDKPKGRSTKIVMVAFDLLYLSGHDL